MANRYRNAGVTAGVQPTLLLSCPSTSKAVVIHSLFISNLSDTQELLSSIQVFKSALGRTVVVTKNIKIPIGSTLIIDKVINLEPSDNLYVSCSVNNMADVFASYLENV